MRKWNIGREWVKLAKLIHTQNSNIVIMLISRDITDILYHSIFILHFVLGINNNTVYSH